MGDCFKHWIQEEKLCKRELLNDICPGWDKLSDKCFWRPLVNLLNCYNHKPIFLREEVTKKIARHWFWEEKTLVGWTIMERAMRAAVSKAQWVWWTCASQCWLPSLPWAWARLCARDEIKNSQGRRQGQEVRHNYSASLESWPGAGTTVGQRSCAGTLSWHTLQLRLSCEVCNLSRKLCVTSGRLEYICLPKWPDCAQF